MAMKMVFLRMEWPGCPSIEVSSEGLLTVDDEEVAAEEFTLALARMAQAWKDSVVKPPPDYTTLYAYLVRGPLPFWTEDADDKATPPPPDSLEEQ